MSQSSKEYHKLYRLKNKEKISKAKKQSYLANQAHYLAKGKNYRAINPGIMKIWRVEHRSHINMYNKQYSHNRAKIDPLFKLSRDIRKITCKAITRGGYVKNSKTENILGCSFVEFQRHIQDKFLAGMHWNNHGKWHIDHVVPLSSAKSEEELIKLSHFTNLQPLWAKDNLVKGSKIYANIN